MASHGDSTTDHKVIQHWIESRGGKRGPGILRTPPRD